MKEEKSDIICPLTSHIVTLESTETGSVQAECMACAVWLRTRNAAFSPLRCPVQGVMGHGVVLTGGSYIYNDARGVISVESHGEMARG